MFCSVEVFWRVDACVSRQHELRSHRPVETVLCVWYPRILCFCFYCTALVTVLVLRDDPLGGNTVLYL